MTTTEYPVTPSTQAEYRLDEDGRASARIGTQTDHVRFVGAERDVRRVLKGLLRQAEEAERARPALLAEPEMCVGSLSPAAMPVDVWGNVRCKACDLVVGSFTDAGGLRVAWHDVEDVA